MIYLQHSFKKLNNHISVFNINFTGAEEKQVLKLLQPVSDILDSVPKNSVYIYKSGGFFHSEALLQIGEKYVNPKSVGCSLEDTISKLVPRIIELTSSNKLLPRNKQITMGGDEVIEK